MSVHRVKKQGSGFVICDNIRFVPKVGLSDCDPPVFIDANEVGIWLILLLRVSNSFFLDDVKFLSGIMALSNARKGSAFDSFHLL